MRAFPARVRNELAAGPSPLNYNFSYQYPKGGADGAGGIVKYRYIGLQNRLKSNHCAENVKWMSPSGGFYLTKPGKSITLLWYMVK